MTEEIKKFTCEYCGHPDRGHYAHLKVCSGMDKIFPAEKKPSKPCSQCERPGNKGKGLCGLHYNRQRKHPELAAAYGVPSPDTYAYWKKERNVLAPDPSVERKPMRFPRPVWWYRRVGKGKQE